MKTAHPLPKAGSDMDSNETLPPLSPFFGSRRLLITSNGCLGLGSRYMVEGDQVILLIGARTPFILRKFRAKKKIFIEDASVHGFMHSEMVESVRNRLGPVNIA